MGKITKIFLIFLLVFLTAVVYAQPLFAYVMSSGSYQIESDDALTPAGGLGTSSNYIFKDTMGELSMGVSNSALYRIKAGFQEMQETSLSVSSPADATLSPAIPGISGGTADAGVTWNVQTDSLAGFDMKANASVLPAMRLPPDGTYYFDDYPTTPTYGWNIGLNAAKFGFNLVPGTTGDAVSALKDNGASCGAGENTGNCWAGFNGTTLVAVLHRTGRTSAEGEDELINFRAESNKFLKAGDYSALVTVTVSSN